MKGTAMQTKGLCFPGEKTAINPDAFFAPRDNPLYQKARELCLQCPLYWDCQTAARDEGIPYGIWGGQTQTERERYWSNNGGRPEQFTRAVARASDALLQERRDYENFDFQHGNSAA